MYFVKFKIIKNGCSKKYIIKPKYFASLAAVTYFAGQGLVKPWETT